MTRKKKNDEFRRLLGYILAASVIVAVAGITPTGPRQIEYNYTAMYICLFFVGANIIAKIGNLIKPNWISEYLDLVLPTLAVGVPMLNLIYASLRDWRWIALLALMHPIAIALPFLNQKLSTRLADEIVAPTSCLGKIIVFVGLAIAPSAGMIGVWLSGISERTGNGVIGYSIVGFFVHFIVVWGEIDLAQQAWENLPERMKGNG